MVNITLGSAYRLTRRYDEGVAHLRKMFDMYPSQSGSVNYHLAWIYIAKGMYQEALDTKVREPITLASIYAAVGKQDEALKVLNQLLEAEKREYVDPVMIAQIYTILDDKENAFRWLDKGYHERSGYMKILKADPVFDPLRSDPRFVELCKKMGLE